VDGEVVNDVMLKIQGISEHEKRNQKSKEPGVKK